MVTGDNLQTAKAIALECGILDSEASATEPNLIDGRAFRELSEKGREAIAEKILVYDQDFLPLFYNISNSLSLKLASGRQLKLAFNVDCYFLNDTFA